MENPQPKLYEAFQLSQADKESRMEKQLDDTVDDPYDEIQIFELIRHINDPQYPLTLEQLNVVNLERIYMQNNLVTVFFTPTIPHCSMAQMIGLMLRVKLLRFLPKSLKCKVLITPGTHVNQLDINKQINDKERVAAAVENPNIGRILMRGYIDSDRFQF